MGLAYVRDGIRKFFWNQQTYEQMSNLLRRKWLGRLRAAIRPSIQHPWALEWHHWYVAQRLGKRGITNAGFNLIPMPRWINGGLNALQRTAPRTGFIGMKAVLGHTLEQGLSIGIQTGIRLNVSFTAHQVGRTWLRMQDDWR